MREHKIAVVIPEGMDVPAVLRRELATGCGIYLINDSEREEEAFKHSGREFVERRMHPDANPQSYLGRYLVARVRAPRKEK